MIRIKIKKMFYQNVFLHLLHFLVALFFQLQHLGLFSLSLFQLRDLTFEFLESQSSLFTDSANVVK